jgi:OmpA-OmpF porin, OOP family
MLYNYGFIVSRRISRQWAIIAAVFLMGCTIFMVPQVNAQNEGHPLITAFTGSQLEGQEVKEYDEQQLVIGKVQPDGTVQTEKLQGKVTRLDYRDPDNRSSLERMRNYEQALKKGGFEIIYNCSNEECGPEIQIETIGYFPSERYLTALQKRAEGNIWVGVSVAAGPWTIIRIVEEKPMETGMVKITSDLIQKNILKDGHMAVYGIYFDIGKADIKSESTETLSEIANLLNKNSSLQIYVVGHTDNAGNLIDNMNLSKRRAESVVAELITKYKISAERIQAGGVGPMAPVTTNDTEQGRALNRRVEIVKK